MLSMQLTVLLPVTEFVLQPVAHQNALSVRINADNEESQDNVLIAQRIYIMINPGDCLKQAKTELLNDWSMKRAAFLERPWFPAGVKKIRR
jgi:hypothetical protein